ncbi:hypothetical protein ACQRB4_06665, partial [Peptoniphilaceae bacterium SGI.097]
MHKENDHAGAFLLLHGRYSVLAHYLKVSLKNSRFLKIPKVHPQKDAPFLLLLNQRLSATVEPHCRKPHHK